MALARKHVERVSLDLIFAAPGETLDGWLADLESADGAQARPRLDLRADLRAGRNSGTVGERGRLAAADEEVERATYSRPSSGFVPPGLRDYEVSSFAGR